MKPVRMKGAAHVSEINLAQRLRELRLARSLTLEQVGTVVGVGKSTVRKWETGAIANMKRDKIAKLAEALSTTPAYLMGWSNDPENYENAAETLDLPEGWVDHFDGDMEAAVKAYRAMDADRAVPPDNLTSLPRMTRLPLIGSIACGTPILAEENIEDWVDVPEDARGDFLLRCKGDSMKDARILDGDLVVIRQQDDVQDGQIAAVLIDDEATLKRLFHVPGGAVMLQAANTAYPPMLCGGADEARTIRIIGLATHFISKVV